MNPLTLIYLQNPVTADKKKRSRKRRNKSMPEAKTYEDDCYRCGEGGELVLCDKPKCPKTYHLTCLNLTKPPQGKGWVKFVQQCMCYCE